MINNLKLAFSIFIYVSIVAILFLSVSFLITKKFKNRFRPFYATFLGISKKECFIHATNFLNFLVLFYFLFNIDKFSNFGLYMILLINIASCLLSFNIRIIALNIIYTIISCILFVLLGMINNYLINVIFDKQVYILKILFMIIIGLFIFYITIRKVEVLIRTYKGVRRFS